MILVKNVNHLPSVHRLHIAKKCETEEGDGEEYGPCITPKGICYKPPSSSPVGCTWPINWGNGPTESFACKDDQCLCNIEGEDEHFVNCKTGQYCDKSRTCKECDDKHCIDCPNNTCSECDNAPSSLPIYGPASFCVSPAGKCIRATGGECAWCWSNLANECKLWASGPACSPSLNCDKCQIEYAPSGPRAVSNDGCIKCKDGYTIFDAGAWLGCCQSTCEECDESGECGYCKKGYILSPSSGKCSPSSPHSS